MGSDARNAVENAQTEIIFYLWKTSELFTLTA